MRARLTTDTVCYACERFERKMLIYILNVIFIIIYSYFIKDRKKFVILVCIQLFLIMALRNTTLGVDLPSYEQGYEAISRLNFGELLSNIGGHGGESVTSLFVTYFEGGYSIFNWICAHLGLSFHGFLVLCAAINVFSVGYFIYKYSKKPWLSFVIFSTFGFYTFFFGILRQGLALSMVLISYCCLNKKRYILTAIALFLAFNFHHTALLSIPLLLILAFRRKTISRKGFASLFAISIPLLVFSQPIYENTLVHIMSLMDKNYALHDPVANKMVFLLFAISLIVLCFYNFSKINEKMDSLACYGLIFALYISIFGIYGGNITRALNYYSIFIILLIPNVFSQYKNQKYATVIEAFACILLIAYMYAIMNGSELDPYLIYSGALL